MTIKSFVFGAARGFVGTQGRKPTWSHRRCRSTFGLHSRGSWRHATVRRIWYPATLGSIWPTQIRRYSSSRSFCRFFLPLGSPISRHCRQRRAFFCDTPLRVPHARRMSLPRNYFRMIPIAGQIKTALSAASRADRRRSPPLVCELSASTI